MLATWREVPAPDPPRAAVLPWWSNPLALLFVAGIYLYRYGYPNRFKRKCIYEPTCSRYTEEAIRRFGLVKGLLVARDRLKRCNGALYLPGPDPVPYPQESYSANQ